MQQEPLNWKRNKKCINYIVGKNIVLVLVYCSNDFNKNNQSMSWKIEAVVTKEKKERGMKLNVRY
jgi:hypothetical protein